MVLQLVLVFSNEGTTFRTLELLSKACEPFSSMNLPAYHILKRCSWQQQPALTKTETHRKIKTITKKLSMLFLYYFLNISRAQTHTRFNWEYTHKLLFTGLNLWIGFLIPIFSIFSSLPISFFQYCFHKIRILRDSEQTYVVATFC